MGERETVPYGRERLGERKAQFLTVAVSSVPNPATACDSNNSVSISRSNFFKRTCYLGLVRFGRPHIADGSKQQINVMH